MKHTAKRLIPYAINGVIHINKVFDPALRRLCKNRQLQPLIRRALKEYGEHYELLIPYQVDDEEMQLKRYIQLKLGTTVNLSELRRKYRKYYLKLYKYGSPADVIRKWGLEVTYDNTMTEEELWRAVEQIADNGKIKKIGRNSRLYQSLSYQARKHGMSVSEYLAQKGYKYKGRGLNARGY